MWIGTPEQFYEFYTVAAKHLKSCFPDIMIGGYSAVGVYGAIRDHAHEKYRPWFDTLQPILDGFFDYIKDKDVPLDFFSWHIYTLNPEEVSASARYVREYLDGHGYKNTESYLTEFNYDYSLRSKPTLFQRSEFSADVLGALIEGQNSPVDKVFYYDFRPSAYNGMFYVDPLVKEIKKAPAFNAMKFFGDIFRLENQVEVEYEHGRGIYALGASNGETTALTLASREYDGKVDIVIDKAEATVLSQVGNGALTEKAHTAKDGKITIDVNKEGIYYISF